MPTHESINYIEFPAKDLAATETFFKAVFNWTFESYGPAYTAFFQPGLDGGFFQSDKVSHSDNGAVLIIFYSAKLEETQTKVETAGGTISKPIFSFPGGRRFHFTDPSGNEFAVWSEPSEA